MTAPEIRSIRTGAVRESNPGVSVWTTSGERITLNYVELRPGAITKVDQHANEQINYLLEGRIEVRLGPNGTITGMLSPGDTVIVPPHIEHQFCAVGGPAAMLGILSPVRPPRST